MYAPQQAIKDMRVNIKDCLGILREYEEIDFGIDDVNLYRNLLGGMNPYRTLLESLIVSLYYVDELGDWLNRGAPDQR